MRVLGVNAVFHDPAAALVVDGEVVAAAEEERFSRRKHGKSPVAFSTWELPTAAMRWCLERGGLDAGDLDAVTYSYDPSLVDPALPGTEGEWEPLRTMYAERFGRFLATALPGVDPAVVRYVPHHLAHAASAALVSPHPDSAVMVADGRGESASYLAGEYRDGEFVEFGRQPLPHSLGLLYEDLTEHLGFRRSSDEYKVMALASYGSPRFQERLSRLVHADDHGGFITDEVDFSAFAPPRAPGAEPGRDHADLAASVQRCVEEVLLTLARRLAGLARSDTLCLAGGVALNCVANTRLHAEGPFRSVWVQPASGDAGTALGGAVAVATELGDHVRPPADYALGRGWSDEDIERVLREADVEYSRPHDIADEAARALADDRIVAWFQGRSEFGPRALGNRSLLAHPGPRANLDRLNAVKGRERFRPVAPMVLAEHAPALFTRGPADSPYMLFVHDVAEQWRPLLGAVTHVDGTARIQSVDAEVHPLVTRMLRGFHDRTGLPVVVNTSLNTAGRPMVDSPRDALECFGSAPVDLLAIGPFAVWRRGVHR